LERGFNYLSGRAREINYLAVYTEIRVELTSGAQLIVYDMGNSEMPILESGLKINLYIDPKDVVII
jgi:hypothetical protein